MKKILDILTGLVRGPLNWIFRKTPIGKLIDGYKTEIGFSLMALRTLLGVVLTLATEASGLFPGVEALPKIIDALLNLQGVFGQALETVGAGFFTVGVYDDKIKRKIEQVKA